MVDKYIRMLVDYGLRTGLIEKIDEIFTINAILEVLQLDEYNEADLQIEASKVDVDEEKKNQTLDAYSAGASKSGENGKNNDLEYILKGLLDYACEKGIVKENSVVYRDLFDTKLMGTLMPRPREVIKKFNDLYKISPRTATDFYYKFSGDSDYIRRYRVKKDLKWVTETEYGDLDITINLSKPEKDPKAIAAAKLARQSGYPKCLLCAENEGYAGRINHPARQNHRIIPIEIDNQDWGFQYSPYVYYNEHCIVFNKQHIPMKIDKAAFGKLFDFVRQFPHYFVGSNADLPIVGGSILAHEHFQGGNYTFAMAKAPIEMRVAISDFEDVEAGIVKWPMSVIRTRSKNSDRLVELGDRILTAWREYSDEDSFIFAYTDGEPHNTITPIARKVNDTYELDLVLRNNITTPEHPLGVYHPHAELHHIKKENIGLIEVMGLAVLPSRLKTEMELLQKAMLDKTDLRKNEILAKHADWADEIKEKYFEINDKNITEILQKEIGLVFAKVLEHAGVYKRDEKGKNAFIKFIDSI